MKEKTWNECIDSNSSTKVSPDKAKARSLIDTSKGRIIFLNENPIKEENANYLFESYYTSVLELMHSLVILEGYNVKNHICLGFYLRDILKKEELFRTFDDLRYKRNSLTYYGRQMDFIIAKEAIKKSQQLIKSLEKLLTKLIFENQ